MWRLSCTLLLLFGLSGMVSAQWRDTTRFNEFDGQPLDRVLVEIQNRTSNSFAYEPRVVAHIVVHLPAEPVRTVAQFLSLVLKNTGLNYKIISGVYAIYPDPDQVAQRRFSIFGIITDSSSGERLPYANIQLLNTRRQTISNSEGNFSLLNIEPDKSVMSISYLGYKSRLIRGDTLPAGKPVSIALSPARHQLPPVNIKSDNNELFEMNSLSGRISVNPVTIAKMPGFGEADIFSAMKALPGLTTTSETANSTAIRGSGGSNTLVTLDGMTIYHTDHLYGLFSAFNTSYIKNVQLYRGGFDSQKGDRTGGVIELTGKDGSTGRAGAVLQASLLSANALIELPVVENKASLVVAFRRTYTDLLATGPYKTLFNNVYSSSSGLDQQQQPEAFEGNNPPDFHFYDLNVKFSFKPTMQDAISLNFFKSHDALAMDFLNKTPAFDYASTDTSAWGNTGSSMKWGRQWSPKYYSQLIAGISHYQTDLSAAESVYLPSGDLFSRRYLDSETGLKDYVIKQNNSFRISSTQKFDFGFDAAVQQVNHTATDAEKILENSSETGRDVAVYLQSTSRFGRWEAVYGFRGSWLDPLEGFYLQPRLAVNYEVSKKWTLRAAAGKYIQPIQRLNEQGLYLNLPEGWIISGPEGVPVQKSYFLSAGGSFSHNDFSVGFTLYKKWESGLTELLYPELVNGATTIEGAATGGEKNITGFDALLTKKTRQANYWLSYSWIFSQSRFPNINSYRYFRSGLFPEHELKLAGQWHVKRWFFSAAFALASNRFFTPIEGVEALVSENSTEYRLLPGQIHSEGTGIYHRADLAAGYVYPFKKAVLEVGASLYNVYNRKNLKNIDYFIVYSESSPPEPGRRNIYGLGILPMVYAKLRL